MPGKANSAKAGRGVERGGDRRGYSAANVAAPQNLKILRRYSNREWITFVLPFRQYSAIRKREDFHRVSNLLFASLIKAILL